jgi:hypothetical protein
VERASLLEEARTATPAARIGERDRIADFGTLGIDAVKPWLSDAVLAAFAIRVIERAGVIGEPKYAATTLRSARKKVPASIMGDLDWALQRMRDIQRPVKLKAASTAGTGARLAAVQHRQAMVVRRPAR